MNRRRKLNEQAIRLALDAKRNVLLAVRLRVEQQPVFGAARAGAFKVLEAGGTEADALMAAQMSLFESIRYSCGGSEEDGETHSAVIMMPSGDVDIMSFFKVLADQGKIPKFVSLMLLGLIEAAGGRLDQTTNQEAVAALAGQYSSVMGIADLRIFQDGPTDGRGN